MVLLNFGFTITSLLLLATSMRVCLTRIIASPDKSRAIFATEMRL